MDGLPSLPTNQPSDEVEEEVVVPTTNSLSSLLQLDTEAFVRRIDHMRRFSSAAAAARIKRGNSVSESLSNHTSVGVPDNCECDMCIKRTLFLLLLRPYS